VFVLSPLLVSLGDLSLDNISTSPPLTYQPPISINKPPTRNYSSSFSAPSFSYSPSSTATYSSSGSRLSQLLSRSIAESHRQQESSTNNQKDKEKESNPHEFDYFATLPDELIINILSRLSVLDLCRISQASQRMNCLASDNYIWIPLYTKIWGAKGIQAKAYRSRVDSLTYFSYTFNRKRTTFGKQLFDVNHHNRYKFSPTRLTLALSFSNNLSDNYKTRLCKQINEWKCPREAQINNRFTLDAFHDNTVNSVQFDKKKV